MDITVMEEARVTLKPVVVTWLDATSSLDEGDLKNVEHDFVETCTIGFLIKKDREGVTLCTDAHPANDSRFGDRVRVLHSIPRAWIKDIRYL